MSPEGGGAMLAMLLPTMEVGEMRFAVLADPQGATFDVIEFGA